MCLVVNDLPSAESKSPSQFGGVLLASVPAHTYLAPDKGYNTHYTLWCTPQPWRSPPSRRFWLGQFIAFASFLSRRTVVRGSLPQRANWRSDNNLRPERRRSCAVEKCY